MRPFPLVYGLEPQNVQIQTQGRERERELNTRDEFHQMFEAVAGELVGIWNLFNYVCV